MNAQTRQHLEDLKRVGFDVSSLEGQMNSSPVLDKAGDNLIGGGILRQSEFTKYMSKTKEENEILKSQVEQLKSLHDSVDSLKGNEGAYKAALELIGDLEDALEAAGADPEEVKKLSFKNRENLTPPVDKKTEELPKVEEKKVMPMEDGKTYIDAETLNKERDNMIYGNIAMNTVVNQAYEKARKLGIEVTDELAFTLPETIRKVVNAGGNIGQAIDNHFGFSAAETKIAEAKYKKEIDDARQQGIAEGRKMEPQRRMVSREKHPVFDNVAPVSVPETRKSREELMKDLPKNKYGDVEYHLLRGNQDSRINRAVAHYENVQDGTLANAE